MSPVSELMRRTVRLGASDLHLQAGRRPRLRLQGELVYAHERVLPLTREDVHAALEELLDADALAQLDERGVLDASFRDEGGVQWRVHAFEQRNGPGVALRPLARGVPTLRDLHLPRQLEQLTTFHSGLVLVTGSTGSGKTTTLASLLQLLNQSYRKSLITLEDPIEYELECEHALVHQRAIGRDVPSFAQGVRDALRERPDVLSVGELRDLETIRLALNAAETGLLVFATLHAADAAQSLSRVIEVFPAAEQELMREKLAHSLQAVASQVLLHAAEGRERYPACELLLRTPAVANLIREGRFHEVRNCIQTGADRGMILLDDSLADLVGRGLVRLNDARTFATDQRRLPGGRQSTARRHRRRKQAREGERRREPRLATLALANVGEFDDVGFRSGLSTGRTVDLSPSGARLELDHSILLGTAVELTLALDQQVVEIAATVRSCDEADGRYGVGLHFEQVGADAARALEEYLRVHE